MEAEEFDIHRRQKRRATAEAQVKAAAICQKNKDLILEYVDHRSLSKKFGSERQYKNLIYLKAIAVILEKPFNKATVKDIENVVRWINDKEGVWGERKKKITEWTQHDYLITLKNFFKWLKKCEDPKETSWIELPNPESKRLTPKDILTWEEVVTLSQAARTPRDQALPQVLWDSGLRIEELLTMKIGDVAQVNGGSAATLHIRVSKTDIRAPIIVRSAPALFNWLRAHPFRADESAPLWVNWKDKPMDYASARKVLLTLKERSGLKKRVNPHSFRKSSASFYSHLLTPSELKARYGWEQSSRMLNVYCFPDEDKVNEKIMRIHGLKVDDREKAANEESKPRECSWCHTLNPAGQELCVNSACGRSLNPEDSMITASFMENLDEASKRLIKDSMNLTMAEAVRKIAQSLREKKNQGAPSP